MSKEVKNKVFISSTYKDLEPTRKVVANVFQDLAYSVVRMENFPSDASEPDINSIDMLKPCDYFVLILGHKYGTIPEGSDISITHREYREALKMWRKKELSNIFVFIATDEFKIRNSDIEPDNKRQKLKEFKSEIKGTYRYFSSNDDLKDAIYQTVHHSNHDNHIEKHKIFYKLLEIENLLDSDLLETKLKKVEAAMDKVTKGFEHVFKFTPETSLEQPIFGTIMSTFDDYIPNVVFDKNPTYKGRIDRWGIRHVIFRADTAIKLMMQIKKEDLKKIGYEIGGNASKDLFDKVIRRKIGVQLIPGTIEAFVELLNYWDSSGGWGELQIIDNQQEYNKWTLKTENNFLVDETGRQTSEEINRLYSFWEGYINGVLDKALIELGNIYASLPSDLKKLSYIPPYVKISSVKKENDNEVLSDYFTVIFEKHKYGEELEHIEKVSNEIFLTDSDDDITIKNYLSRLANILLSLKSKDSKGFSQTIGKIENSEKEKIKKLLSTEIHKSKVELEEVKEYSKITNGFIQSFLSRI